MSTVTRLLAGVGSTLRRLALAAGSVAVLATAAWVAAHPFPPYWSGGAGAAVHFAPVAWPADGDWVSYTQVGDNVADAAVSDKSNGGTSPQGYVNVSSGCTDRTLPSIYFAYRAGTLFFRWRVQQGPNNYATGPSPGAFSSSNPWNSALWTVLVDTNGDGYRDFAVQLDGSSGSPSAAVDRLAGIYSTTRSQSLDYVGNPTIHLLKHNPTAFVDQPSGRILNFQNGLAPTTSWPNGSSETRWDYGTTRATRINFGCEEYFIDYQIPLGLLDASAVGGPVITSTTPVSLFFATSNSLTNPMQKDVVVAGDFIADGTKPVPFGDTMTFAGGIIPQPIVSSIAAAGCGPTQLTATVVDTLTTARTTTVAAVEFYAWLDANGNGAADDAGSAWAKVADGATANAPVGQWTGTFDTAAVPKGRYLVGVKATDAQGNITHSHLSASEVAALPGTKNFANPSSVGLVVASAAATCGTAPASIAVTVDDADVVSGQAIALTVTITNPGGSLLTVSSISNVLPPGFTYVSTGAGTLAPTASPTAGATGTLQWLFAPATIAAGGTGTLVFTATASNSAGAYSDTASAATGTGTLNSSPVSVSVTAPEATLTASANNTTRTPGQTVVYTFAYSNPSAATLTNVVLTNTLPSGLTFVSTSAGSYNPGTSTVTVPAGSLAPSASGSVAVTATVTNPYPADAPVLLGNTAQLDSDQTSPQSATASIYVSAGPVLSLQLDASAVQVAPGGPVTFTVGYSNVGTGAATGTALTFAVPAGFTFASVSGGGTYDNGARLVSWAPGTVAAGANGSYTVTLQATNPYTGSSPSSHTATMTSNETAAVSDTYALLVTISGEVCSTYYFRDTAINVGVDGVRRLANTTVVTASDTGTSVSATSTGSSNVVEAVRFYQDPPVIGQVTFAGTLSTGIYIDRQNGAGVNVTGAAYDYNPATGQHTSIGSRTTLFNGNEKGLFSFSIPVTGTLFAGHRLLWIFSFASANTNAAMLYFQFGGRASNPESGGTTDAIAQSSFCTSAPATPTLEAQVNPLSAYAGTALTYTLRYGNAGATAMQNTRIQHVLPAGVTLVGATLNGTPVSPLTVSGQTMTYAAGTVGSGASGVLVVNAQVTQPFTGTGQTLPATSSMWSDQTSSISDTTSVRFLNPGSSITKSADRTTVDPGGTVTYTLTLLNTGQSDATNVVVTDVLPAGPYFAYVQGSASPAGTLSGNTLTVPIGTLATGATTTVRYQMRAAAGGAPSGSQFTNAASVTADGLTSPSTANAVSVSVRSAAVLQLTAAAAPSGTVAPSDTITYSVVVTNAGGSDATSVRVVGDLPASTGYVPGSLTVAGAAVTDVVDGDAGSADAGAARVEFSVGTLAAGASKTLTYAVEVVSPLPHGSTPIAASATATAGNAASVSATASVTAEAAAVLSVSMVGPSALAYPLASLSAPAGGTPVVDVGSSTGISIGQMVVIGGTVATVTAISGQQLALDTPVTAAAGAAVLPSIEYVITYANTGNAGASNVQITDALPPSGTFVSATGGVTPVAGVLAWNVGDVAAGGSGTLRVVVAPTAPGLYNNQASATSFLTVGVDSNVVTTSVGSLLIDKVTTTPSGTVTGGQTTVTYVITATNQNPTLDAHDVAVRDRLPTGFTYASTTSVTGSPTPVTSPAPGDIEPTWSGVTVPAGAQVVITFVSNASNLGAGTFQNDAVATSSDSSVIGFDGLTTSAENVTFAAPRGTTAVISTPASFAAGATVTVTLTDIDLDTDPSVAQQVSVLVVNTRTNEAETVVLTETGPATGAFVGSLPTSPNVAVGTDSDGTMNVSAADTLRASHTDPLSGTGGATTVVAESAVSTGGGPTDPVTVTIGPPSVSSTITGPVTYTVTYTGAHAITLASGNITLNATGTATGTVTVSGAGATRTVTISNITGGGTLGISIGAGTATNGAGDPAPGAGPSATVEVLPARALTGLSPTSGLASGGVVVTLTGRGFLSLASPAVLFGGVAAVSVQVISDTEVRVVTPRLPAGTHVDVSLFDGPTPFGSLPLAYTPMDRPAGDTDTDGDGIPDSWELLHGLDPLVPGDGVDDEDGDGVSNRDEYLRGTHPRGTWVRYFAEGVSRAPLATALSIFNPALERTSVVLRFYPEDGRAVLTTLELEPGARTIVDPAQVPDLGVAAYGVRIDASTTIAVESTVSWDERRYGAHSERAVPASTTWYFAEGSTQPPFDLFFLLLNPNDQPVEVSVRYLLQRVIAPIDQSVVIPPLTRLTIWVDQVPGVESEEISTLITSKDLPIVVERAMYSQGDSWWSAGHRAAGTDAPGTSFEIAEGYTGHDFDTFLLLGNPTQQTAEVEVQYLGEQGLLLVRTYEVPPTSRRTLWVNYEDPSTAGVAMSFRTRSVNGVPYLVERAMWWAATPEGAWVESHTSNEVGAAARKWAVAEGEAGGTTSAATFLLVANKSSTAGTVNVTLHFDDGTTDQAAYVIGGDSRLTLDVGYEFPSARGKRFSVVLESTGASPVDIVVEKSLYWDVGGVWWAAGVSAPATPLP